MRILSVCFRKPDPSAPQLFRKCPDSHKPSPLSNSSPCRDSFQHNSDISRNFQAEKCRFSRFFRKIAGAAEKQRNRFVHGGKQFSDMREMILRNDEPADLHEKRLEKRTCRFPCKSHVPGGKGRLFFRTCSPGARRGSPA